MARNLATLVILGALIAALVVGAEATGVRLFERVATSLCISQDRTSNAPVVMYPQPQAQGGAPMVEHWMLDNFSYDPMGGPAMVGTAENCARLYGFRS